MTTSSHYAAMLTGDSNSKCRFKIKQRDQDMPTEQLNQIRLIAEKAWARYGRRADTFAHALQCEFTKELGAGWQCVVGRNFGAYFTHLRPSYAYFYVDKFAVLLWQTP